MGWTNTNGIEYGEDTDAYEIIEDPEAPEVGMCDDEPSADGASVIGVPSVKNVVVFTGE